MLWREGDCEEGEEVSTLGPSSLEGGMADLQAGGWKQQWEREHCTAHAVQGWTG